MRLKQNPYHLLLLTGLALVPASFFLNQNKTIDVHFHDTYYVIAQAQLYILLAVSVLVLWAFYLVTRKILFSKLLTWIHVAVTLLTLLFLLFLLNFNGGLLNQSSRRYLDYSVWKSFTRYEQQTTWIIYVTIALLLGQIAFVVNLIIGIVKRVT